MCTISRFASQEKTRSSAGRPDIAAFLDHKALIRFSLCSDAMDLLEQEFKSIRFKFLPILDRSLAPQQARLEIASLADLLVRSSFSKGIPSNFKIKKHAGKLNADKINILKIAWTKVIDETYPRLGFSVEADLVPPDAEDKMLEEKVEIKHLGVQSPEAPQEDLSQVYVGV